MGDPTLNPFADAHQQPVNPYAAPATHFPPPNMVANYQGGVWRDGKLLVMHKSAQLPPVCVKSGLPSTTWLKRNLSWHHPACYLGLLGGLIPFVVIALIMTKRATIQIGLTEERAARRRSFLMIGWGIGVLGLLVVIGSFVLLATTALPSVPDGAIVLGIPVGIITAIVGMIVGSVGAATVTPKKIDNTYVWLKGVHPDVLAMFPDLPKT